MKLKAVQMQWTLWVEATVDIRSTLDRLDEHVAESEQIHYSGDALESLPFEYPEPPDDDEAYTKWMKGLDELFNSGDVSLDIEL